MIIFTIAWKIIKLLCFCVGAMAILSTFFGVNALLSGCSPTTTPEGGENQSINRDLSIENISASTEGMTGLALKKRVPVSESGFASLHFDGTDDHSSDVTGDGLEIVTETPGKDFRILLPPGHRVHHHAIGRKYKSEGKTILVINTDLEVKRKGNGRTIRCLVLALSVGNTENNPKCLQEKDDAYSSIVPVAVTLEFQSLTALTLVEGDEEKVYFALNKPGGGFIIKRWNGRNEVEVIREYESGNIDRIYGGDVLIAAIGKDGNNGIVFYGKQDPLWRWRFTTVFPSGVPIFFNDTVFYTKVDHPTNDGFYNVHISLTVGNSTHYTNAISLDCALPDRSDDIFIGGNHAYWLSAENGKLCSVTPKTGNELFDYLIVDESITWLFGASYENVMFLYGLSEGLPHLELVDMAGEVITKTNLLLSYEMSEVIDRGISQYQNGIKIKGKSALDNSDMIIFYNVNDGDVETDPTESSSLYQYRKL